MATSSWLRVAVIQFAPKLGEVYANIAKARELCQGLTPRSVDLVCFPEMIFSGYMFPDAPSIAPYLEHPKTGPTSTFCAELARNLQCYVAAGFPERLDSEPSRSPSTTTTRSTPNISPGSSSESDDVPPALVGANAALLYDATGSLCHTYRKSNLFPTDLTWARPGCGFAAFDLPWPFGRTAVAICNDLNVNVGEWRSIEEGPYELAGWCRRENVRVLVLLNAWLKSEEETEEGKGRGVGATGHRDDRDRESDQSTGAGENDRLDEDDDDADSGEMENDGDDGSEPNWRVLNYWAMRLRPLWAKDVDANMDTEEGGTRRTKTSAEMMQTNDERDVLVVICNRFGHEQGKIFAGSSAMFSMRSGSGKPRLLHVMGEREESTSIWSARIGSNDAGVLSSRP